MFLAISISHLPNMQELVLTHVFEDLHYALTGHDVVLIGGKSVRGSDSRLFFAEFVEDLRINTDSRELKDGKPFNLSRACAGRNSINTTSNIIVLSKHDYSSVYSIII